MIEEVAENSTHGSGDRLVLGKWEETGGYLAEAKNNGGVFFETADGVYDAMKGNTDAVWAVNEKVLENTLSSGISRIDFYAEPFEEILTTFKSTARAKELRWLNQNALRYGFQRSGTSWFRLPTFAPTGAAGQRN